MYNVTIVIKLIELRNCVLFSLLKTAHYYVMGGTSITSMLHSRDYMYQYMCLIIFFYCSWFSSSGC